ncbi:hypothetical protein BDR05DRAFT_1000806 [Suillus weaverae]|nr:hypothetical protein BDR05DRAFT_1000806 [Suillus weaverae]
MPPPDKSPDDWTPYRSHIEFKTTEFLYTCNQMSAGNINILLDLWATTLLKHNDKPPFADCCDLYKTIDSTPVGDIKWQSFKVQYTGEKLAHNIPPWMDQPYDVWYRDPHEVVHNMLVNPEYATEMDYRPYCEYSSDSDEHQWQDFMSSDWAWNQVDIISEDPEMLGSMFVPVILGSDKTTECSKQCDDLDAALLCWCCDHTEVLVEEIDYSALWLEYGIVSDLVPFTNDFPRGNIHELIAPDILHQPIKGTFKDHLVTWVVASFAGLQRFPEGRGFKQWTGDNLKVLMKVYLPAIQGHVPTDMVCAFLEFCYLVQRNVITESMLVQIQEALDRFHQYREIFKSTGVIPTFSLPRQHSCSHYILLIQLFGAPNGLCLLITETKHIKAVKEPWMRSSCYKALSQMLLTNQHLDKLAVARVDFKSCGMLNSTCLSATLEKLMADTDRHDDSNENIMVLPSNVGVTILGDNEEGEIDDSPTLVQAHVQLAKTYHIS